MRALAGQRIAKVKLLIMKNVCIFGAGAAGIRVYHHYKKKCNIIAFIDNDPAKQNTRLFGVDVISADAAKTINADEIFIASSSFDAIKTQLEQIFAGSSVQFIRVKERFIDPKSGIRTGWLTFFAAIITVYLFCFMLIFFRVKAYAI